MKQVPIFLILFLFQISIAQNFSSVSENSNTANGIREYKKEHYAVAYSYFIRDTQLHDPICQNYLGLLFEKGSGVTKNEKEAFAWYLKAANQGYPIAQSNLGQMYEYGKGVDADIQEALKWYQMSAENGSSTGQTNLADLYFYGEKINKNDSLALYWYSKSALQGNKQSWLRLGEMYGKEPGTRKKDSLAMYWYKKAAESGLAVAQYRLGWRYYNGKGCQKNDSLAFYWHSKAAEKGYAESQNYLGLFYEEGKGVKQNDSLAIFWYTKAIDGKSKYALNNLKDLRAKNESKNPANYLKASYKSGLTIKDKSDIQKRAKECFNDLAEFEFNISPADILPYKSRIFEYPSNRKKADELKKLLQKNPSDETICMGLGSIYMRLKNGREAKLYLDSASNIIKRNLIKIPNDSTQMSNLAWVYLISNDFIAALREYDNYLIQYPGSLYAMEGRLFCFFGNGDKNKLSNECNKIIEKYPEEALPYMLGSLYRILEIANLPKDSIVKYKKLPIDDFIDIHEMSAAAKTYSNNYEIQFVYNGLRQMCLFAKVISQEQKLSENDRNEVKRLEMFYEDGLKRKDQANKFTFYKLLGALNMIDYNKNKAIEYTRKAIENKEKEDTLKAPNTTGLYDQLAAIYLLDKNKKDAEKILREKIQKTGAFFENGHDYLVLASYEVLNGNLERAKSNCFISMEIDSSTVDDAYLGLATIDVLNGNTINADAELNIISEKNWKKPNFLALKGIVSLLNGNYKTAKEYFIQSKENDGDFELPKQLLNKYFIE